MVAAWTTFKAVGWRVAALVAASLCFEAMVALRDWHEQYAITPVWAEEVAKADRKWSPVIGQAAANLKTATFVSKDDMYDVIERYVQDAKRWPVQKEQHLASYHAALAERERLRNDLKERHDAVDDDFAPMSQARARLKADIAALKKNPQPDEKAIAAKTRELAELKPLSTQLALLNAERAAIEAGFAKRIEAKEKEISSAEAALRKAFDAGAKYARPVSGTAAAFRMRVGNEADARHIFYVVSWYVLELLILALLFIPTVALLLAVGGPAATAESVKSPFMNRIRAFLGSVFGQRTTAAVGKAVATLAVGAVGVAGINAAAGDSVPVLPAIAHPVHEEAAAGRKGDRGDAGDPGEVPPEIAKLLAEQAAAIREQALTLEEQKLLIAAANDRLSAVANDAKATAAAAATLATEAKAMAGNMTNLAAAATASGMTLGSLNDGMSRIVEAQQWSLLVNNTATRQLNQSMADLQLAEARTVSGVANVVTQAADHAGTNVDRHATSIRVGALGGGFLPAVNPFYRYRVTGDVVRTVMKAADAQTPEARRISAALTEMTALEPMRVRGFKTTLRAKIDDPAAKTLLEQLMPLIVKVSRVSGGTDAQAQPARMAKHF